MKVLIAAIWLFAASTQAGGYTITFEDRTGLEGVEISPYNRGRAATPLPKIDGAWTYNDGEFDSWISTPRFLIKLPSRAASDKLLVGHPPITYSISFNIPADLEEENFIIPMVAFPSISENFLVELENSFYQPWEKIMVSAQLVQFWQDRLHSSRGERVLKLWFDAIYQAFEEGLPVRFETQTVVLSQRSKTNKEYFSGMYRGWESVFWTLKGERLNTLLMDRQCRQAEMLISYVVQEHSRNGEFAFLQRVENPAEEIESMRARLASACRPVSSGPASS